MHKVLLKSTIDPHLWFYHWCAPVKYSQKNQSDRSISIEQQLGSNGKKKSTSEKILFLGSTWKWQFLVIFQIGNRNFRFVWKIFHVSHLRSNNDFAVKWIWIAYLNRLIDFNWNHLCPKWIRGILIIPTSNDNSENNTKNKQKEWLVNVRRVKLINGRRNAGNVLFVSWALNLFVRMPNRTCTHIIFRFFFGFYRMTSATAFIVY